jgi:hypothetical protein
MKASNVSGAADMVEKQIGHALSAPEVRYSPLLNV